MSYQEEKNELWDNILSYEIATEEELQLITNINGFTVETLEDVLYAKIGYRSWDQFQDCEG